MKTSESIDKLATALNKAQASMTGAKKASNNPFFKSKYSDLSEVMAAISQPFSENGLCFVQGAEFDENKIAVSTRVIHTSGQWIESITVLPPTKNDAQGYGSAITYAKRYGLQALCGVPSVDDDGNDATKHSTNKSANVAPIKKQIANTARFDVKRIASCKTQEQLKELHHSLDKTNQQTYQHLFTERKNQLAANQGSAA